MKIKNYKPLIISSAAIILEAVILYAACLCTIHIDAMTVPFISMVFLLPLTTFGLSVYVGATKTLSLIPFTAVSFLAQAAFSCVLNQELLPWQSLLVILSVYTIIPVAAGGIIGLIIKILVKKLKNDRPTAKTNRL